MSAEVRRVTKAVLTTAAALLAICVPSALALPTGRGYEKVSPADKDGEDISNGLDKAAADGDAATYISFGAFADSEGGGLVTSFLSDRNATNWLTQSIGPPQAVSNGLASSLYVDFSDDVQTGVISFLAGDPGFDGATPGASNLYRRDPDGTRHAYTPGHAAHPAGRLPARRRPGAAAPPICRSGRSACERSATARHLGPGRGPGSTTRS